MANLPSQALTIDEDGYPKMGDARVDDDEFGAQFLGNIRYAENGAFLSVVDDDPYLVEAFDEPYVAHQIERLQDKWFFFLPYNLRMEFTLESLSLDEWDRFHGYALKNKIPFVMSRNAQETFFKLLDEFDDETITVRGQTYDIPNYYLSKTDFESSQYWSKAYQSGDYGWELNQPSPALVEMLPKLKLPKARVLVLGCGSGNDAAHFAQFGHVVTAVDFAAEAIEAGKKKYSNLSNINWIQSDIFSLPTDMDGQFDLIFEHTCFCAINPMKRQELVKIWRKLLVEGGLLVGVFFTMEKKESAPFGATEWELRERLKRGFRIMDWRRWKSSIKGRNGKELFVLAQKK